MNLDQATRLLVDYTSSVVSEIIHPEDHMFNTAVRGIVDYRFVGGSSINSIHAALINAPINRVARVMDFGCGHGRVARHLRALLPDATMFFVDIDERAASFCAEQFRGTIVPASNDFGRLGLPSDIDLIWVGSVFTHLDYDRMAQLFDFLIAALAPNGVLVATFHGRTVYRTMKADTSPQAERWAPLLSLFETEGVAHQPYNTKFGDWGVSLTSPETVMRLGKKHTDVRLVGYTETGWATYHDVAAWAKVPV